MSPRRVVIVGAGLAGLSAAVALASRGFAITLLDARPRLGGRASSFTDPSSGQTIDACQHVSMRCCTNLRHFLQLVGADHLLQAEPTLYFYTPDGRESRFGADPYPAPLHLSRAFASAHYLTAAEKLRVAWGLFQLLRLAPEADAPLLPWLQQHRQTPRTIDRFWGIVLVSALNESIDRVGTKYARKVFRDGFLRHRDAYIVDVPRGPLAELYGEPLQRFFQSHAVTVHENTGVRQVLPGTGVLLRDGRTLEADEVILAVPFDRVADLLPADLLALPFVTKLQQLTPSPITSVHLWFESEQPLMPRPHAVLLEGLGQWVFARPGGYLQVVVSAARLFRGQPRATILQDVHAELARLFPNVRSARLLRSRVVTEHTATFSAVPGVDELRPEQETPVPGLTLAGDYTRTGWPATMEGAVRSGRLAAEVLLRRAGRPEALITADL
ncbi:MAG: hydroxysqualene dehydroxylase HpnE [Gemmataceae bacterium]